MFTTFKRKLAIALVILFSLIAIGITALLPTSHDTLAESVTFTAIDGTTGNSGESYDKLFDGKKKDGNYTKWCVNKGDDDIFVVIDASQEINLSFYVFTTANDNADHPGRNPKSWALYGCNDYDNTEKTGTWNTIQTVVDDDKMQDVNFTDYGFDVINNEAYYRYYKFVISETQGSDTFQLCAMAFNYSTDKTLSYSAVDGIGTGNEGYDKLFDGKNTESSHTKWCTEINDGIYVTFKTNKPVIVTSYTLTTGNDNASWNGRNPESWTLYGSIDYDETTKTGNWDVIHTVENDETLQDENYASYSFNTTTHTLYRYYKFEITKNEGAKLVQLCGLEFSAVSECEHTWSDTYTTQEATCTTPSYKIYSCSSCDGTKKEISGKANGHSWTTTSFDEATCTEAKKLHQTCSVCEASQTIDDGEPNGHSWTTTSTDEATCTEAKKIHQTCSVCEATQTMEEGRPNGHDYVRIPAYSTDATCVSDGTNILQCQTCHYSKTETVKALGHEYIDGYCKRCNLKETGVTVGAFIVTGGVKDTDYKYENNVLTVLTSTPLIIANVDVNTATSDRIYIEKDVSANITLAGVNIDNSCDSIIQTHLFSGDKYGESPIRIGPANPSQANKGKVTITLAENTVNTLRGGPGRAGIEAGDVNKDSVSDRQDSLTINGKGKLIVYGGQKAPAIGQGYIYYKTAAYTCAITIKDCIIEAYASCLSDGTHGTIDQISDYTPAIGSFSSVNGGNITFINATVTAEGYNNTSIGAKKGSFNEISVVGGSIKGSTDSPVDENGNALYLLTIANPNGGIITIDGKYYSPVAHSSTDTNVYAYLRGVSHDVWAGDEFYSYSFDSENSAFVLNSGVAITTPQPKAFTVTATNDTDTVAENVDYTYSEGVLTILSDTEMTITSSGLTTTDRIIISADNAQVTLNGVNIDVSATEDACALQVVAKRVYVYLAIGSTNVLKSGKNQAGLGILPSGSASYTDYSTFVEGDGTLYAYGGENGAGIGGGNEVDVGTIYICDHARVYAYGGENGAGIGSCGTADVFIISFSNATVTAVGGENGAGIGGGVSKTTLNSIEITGSSVLAKGGLSGAGIGGNNGAKSKPIYISKSTVIALGGNAHESAYSYDDGAGAGIGGGYNGEGENVYITDSSVNAIGGTCSDGSSANAIGGGEGQDAVLPLNGKNGSPLYLLVIANPNSKTVYLDGSSTSYTPSNSASLSDTNLYAYLTGGSHYVTFGTLSEKTYYGFTSSTNAFHVCVKSSNFAHDDDSHWYTCETPDCETKFDVCEHTHDQKVESDEFLVDENKCTYDKRYNYSCVCGHEDTTSFTVGTGTGHDFPDEWTTISDSKHSKTCNNCGGVLSVTHAYDKQVVSADYLCSEADCTNPAKYYYSCKCGKKGTEVFSVGTPLGHDYDEKWTQTETHHYHACTHTGCTAYDEDTYGEHEYSHDCDATCNVCSYVRTNLTHQPSESWSYDETSHYHTCERTLDDNTPCTAKTDSANHTYELNKYTYVDGKHYRKCDICDYYDLSTEEECETEIAYDDAYHWQQCKVCKHKFTIEEEHSFTNACDETCNHEGCAYTRVITHDYKKEWSYNDTEHYHECSICSDKTDVTAHTGLDKVYYNETHHYHECSGCKAIIGKETHVYDDENDFTCNNCDYYIPQKIGSLKFTYSGYEVNGNVHDFKVISDANNKGIKWDENKVYDWYWWIIPDLDEYLTDYGDYLYGNYTINSTDYRVNSYIYPERDYYLGLYIEADTYYSFDNVNAENFYVEGVGYAIFVDDSYLNYNEIRVYFKLPKLTGESTIQNIPSLNFLGKNYVLDGAVTDFTITADESNALTPEFGFYRIWINNSYMGSSWYESQTFSTENSYSLSLVIFAPEGYAFKDFDGTSVTLTVNGKQAYVLSYYAYNDGACVEIYFALPSLEEEHVHDFKWNSNEYGHYKECDCGFYETAITEENFQHTYTDEKDAECNDCGYIRQLYIEKAEFVLSGYEMDKHPSNVTVTASENSYGFDILFYVVCYSIGDDVSSLTGIRDTDKIYFSNDYTFWIAVLIQSESYSEDPQLYYYFNLNFDEVTVKDLCSAYACEEGGGETMIIYFKLPALTGESQFKSISGAEFTLSGYEKDSLVKDATVAIADLPEGVASYSFSILKDGSAVSSDTEKFAMGTEYSVSLTLKASDGYLFRGTTLDSFKLLDSYEPVSISFSMGLDEVYITYSLLKLSDEHEHDYSYSYDDEKHYHVCSVCSLKENTASHVYDDDNDATCNVCSYVRELPVKKVTLVLNNYGYAKNSNHIFVSHNENCLNSIDEDAYGNYLYGHYYYCLGTSENIGQMNFSSYLDYEYLKGNTRYFLAVMLVVADGYKGDLTKENVTLEGHGTAINLIKLSGRYVATFKLNELIPAHAHNGELTKVDGVSATASKEGNITYYYCEICKKYFSDAKGENEIALADTVIPKLAPTIIEGDKGVWTQKSNASLAFKSDALKSDFIEVTIDGELVDENNYTLDENELIITLNAEYLKTLSVGEHSISVKSQSGTATASFTVRKSHKKGLSVGGWIGISLGGVAVLAGAAFGAWFFIKKRKNLA